MSKAVYRIFGEDQTAAVWKSILGNAQGTANKIGTIFKTAFAALGLTAVVGKLAGLGKEAIATGDALNNFRIKSKLSAESASELAYAASQSDVELDGLGTALQKMQIFLSKAESGEKANVAALRALGIEISDIRDLRPDQQFEAIAEQVSLLRSEEDQARAVTEVFGKAGANLLPMFQQGAKGIREAREEAQKLGHSFNEEQLRRLAEADDAVKRMGKSWDAMWITLTAKVAPAVRDVADSISGFDSRTQLEKINDQIDELHNKIYMPGSYSYSGGHLLPPEMIEKTKAQLEKLLRLRRAIETGSGDGIGGRGRPGGGRDRGNAPPGFSKDDSLDKAEAQVGNIWDTWDRMQEDIGKKTDVMIREFNEPFIEELETWSEHQRIFTEAAQESADALAEYQREIFEKNREVAEATREEWRSVFQDMAADGKFSWDELLDYMKRRWIEKGIDRLFEIFWPSGDQSGGTGSGGMGIVQGEWDWMDNRNRGPFGSSGGGAFGWLGSIFGFAKGGRPPVGKPSLVGESGPELFVPDAAGTVIPNQALRASGPQVSINYNIDARGATTDLVRALPGILKAHGESVKNDLIDGLRRRRYVL